jgi:hypothetical protein
MDRAGPFQALEHRFEILSDLPGAVGLVERLFASFEDGCEGGQPTVYELRRSDAGALVLHAHLDDSRPRRARGDRNEPLCDRLIEAGRRAVASAHPIVVVHAGVVSYRGRGILMPAPPDHGKSTLTTASCARAARSSPMRPPRSIR